jgi:hypothetical protein
MSAEHKAAVDPATAAERGEFKPLKRPLPRGRVLVVLGNGPSLAGFDFSRFRGFDAIGMNAAYRYWDEIGWYPRISSRPRSSPPAATQRSSERCSAMSR